MRLGRCKERQRQTRRIVESPRAVNQPPCRRTLEARTMRQVALRIVPFLMICYFVSFLDRVNLGFAALDMVRDLHLSPTVFGFGGGIFFLSYFLCEVPSNLLLEQVGARRWIARIMVTWGILAGAHGSRDRPELAVPDAVPPRCGRSGVLSRRHPLHHVLVSLRVPGSHHRVVHGCDSRLQLPRFADFRRAPRAPTDGSAFADGSGCSSSRLCPQCCSASHASWS